MPTWVILLLRILLSTFLGSLIGLERKMRYKEAGLRTHAIVSLGSCLFMIVSIYGFENNTNVDPTRIAAQIVSGIGFIGAGMILYRKNLVYGLTTAAGVWSTAGIGMATGAGMYYFAIGTTLIIITTQFIFHLNLNLFKQNFHKIVYIKYYLYENETESLKKLFNIKNFEKFTIEKINENYICNVEIKANSSITDDFLATIAKNNKYIISINCGISDF